VVSMELKEEDLNHADVYSTDVPRIATPTRPRLTNQLRSFISSFKASSAATTPTEERNDDKARTSYEPDDQDGIWPTGKTIGQTTSKTAAVRPNALVMPAARAAGPDGLYGLNDDSPPLTPVSDEAKDSDSVDVVRELTYASSHRHPWAAAQARANEDGTANAIQSNYSTMEHDRMTPVSASTITSGRSSPLLSSLSMGSSVGTYIPSRPTSSLNMFKLSSPLFGLLPSHTITPSSSPPPPEHAAEAYLHASTTSSLFANLLSRVSQAMSNTRLPPLRRHLPALVFLMTAFIGSTLCILLALSTLPLHLPSHITNLSVAEIRDMSLHLQSYSRSSTKAYIHTLSVLAAFYTWKQSYTIPGSLIMNVVFGAMYGTLMGTLYTSILTSLGGVFCYLLMAPLGSLIRTLPGLQTVLDKMQKAMQSNNATLTRQSAPLTAREQEQRRKNAKQSSGNIWSYLLVLRVLPIVPYGLMNIACSVLRVPLLPYAVTLAVGSIPWNACTVQVGDLLVQVVSALDEANLSSVVDGGFQTAPLHKGMIGKEIKAKAQSGAKAIAAKLWNKDMIFKLILMSLVSLAPLLLQRYLRKAKVEGQHNDCIDEDDERRNMTEVDQEASVALRSDNDDDNSSIQSLLPAWRSSWSSPSQAVNAAVAAISKKHSPPPLDTSPSKRYSGVWTTDSNNQSQRHPSHMRAVTATRVN
jgi:uncharacterized membrane protein YdjX (TVP38/TMEM64 family)